MCDYPLSVSQSRSGEEGERLVLHRFSNGVKGFVSEGDSSRVPKGEPGFWTRCANWFRCKREECAVCLPPGARLVLRDVPDSLRSELKLGADEEVTLISGGPSLFSRDGVRFRQGTEILFQWLPEGLVADVLSLSSSVVSGRDALLSGTDPLWMRPGSAS